MQRVRRWRYPPWRGVAWRGAARAWRVVGVAGVARNGAWRGAWQGVAARPGESRADGLPGPYGAAASRTCAPGGRPSR